MSVEAVPEIKQPRTKEEVQKDYAALCAQAGETQYRIASLEGSLTQINQRLSHLNTEAMALADIEAKKQAEQGVKDGATEEK